MKRILLTGAALIFLGVGCTASPATQTYKNLDLHIALELPSTWYVSDAIYSDPHFYANKECSTEDRPQCTVVELQNANELVSGGVQAMENKLKKEKAPYTIVNLIPNATVIKTGPEEGTEGYSEEYYIFFPKENRALIALAINHEGDKTAEDILATLQFVQK